MVCLCRTFHEKGWHLKVQGRVMNIRGIAVAIALSMCASGCGEGPKGEPGAAGPPGAKGEPGAAGPPGPAGHRPSRRGRSCWSAKYCRERHSSYTFGLHGPRVQRGMQPE
jgi:hypothetical protein